MSTEEEALARGAFHLVDDIRAAQQPPLSMLVWHFTGPRWGRRNKRKPPPSQLLMCKPQSWR